MGGSTDMDIGQCGNCRFWEDLEPHAKPGEPPKPRGDFDDQGTCMRNAPRPAMSEELFPHEMVAWPRTNAGDWCGEWEQG